VSDGLMEVFASPQLPVAIATAVAAGLVYGFAGFGAALIAVPLLAAVYSPADAVGIFALSALASLVTVVPQAWREGDRRATAQLLASAAVTLPVGVYVLRTAPSDALRWAICLLVLGTLTALVLGWRRQGTDRAPSRVAVGAATGVVGGATGLTGPVVVLFQLSGREDAGCIRANIMLFLSLLSVLMLPLLVVSGVLGQRQATVGLVLLPAYALATSAGQALFRSGNEGLYRIVAYAVVAAAGVAGLPVWG
jgi:uncharacterized membrane protein YfcA